MASNYKSVSAAFSATSASGLSASSLVASANKINEGDAGNCKTDCVLVMDYNRNRNYNYDHNFDYNYNNDHDFDYNYDLNLYYDFNRGQLSRVTPYIGAGIGLDSRRFKRVTDQTSACQSSTSRDTVTNVTTYSPISCPAGSPFGSFHDNKYTSSLGFAAAVMAGVSYEVTPGVQLDVGYRALWEGAEVSLGAGSIDGGTTVKLGSKIDQELRTGVRVDLY